MSPMVQSAIATMMTLPSTTESPTTLEIPMRTIRLAVLAGILAVAPIVDGQAQSAKSRRVLLPATAVEPSADVAVTPAETAPSTARR